MSGKMWMQTDVASYHLCGTTTSGLSDTQILHWMFPCTLLTEMTPIWIALKSE
jgi:hypothetical protein